MNLVLSLVLSTSLVGPARSIRAVELDSGSVAFTTATVWLRTSTDLTAKGIALLPRGAQVQIVGCQDQSCSVSFRRLQGYLSRELLRSTPVRNAVNPGRGYINSRGQWIPSPAQTLDGEAPDGATARCRDGSYSFSQSSRGTCSWHGGVDEWLTRSSSSSKFPHLSPEDALALLQAEHHFSFPILLLEDSATSIR
ncbi:MAG: DUF3761 domain-containing protein [Gemmatimonadales bacterium]